MKLPFSDGMDYGKGNRREYTVLCAVAIIGAALRYYRIGFKELWFDEAYTALLAGGSFADIVARLKVDTAPPLYYAVIWAWSRMFGVSELALRSLSALSGVALIGLTYRVGKKVHSSTAGLIAAALTAVNPIAVMYSQEARMYSITPLLALAVFGSLSSAMDKGKASSWIAYVVAQSALIYTHYHGLFMLPAAWAVFAIRPSRKNLALLVIAQAAVIILFSPWIPVMKGQAASPNAGAWIGYYWLRYPPSLSPIKSLAASTPGGPWPDYLQIDRGWSGAWILAALIGWAIFTTGAVLALRKSDARKNTVAAALFGLTAIIAPIAVSFIVKPIMVVGRYEVAAYPFLIVFVAAGLARLPARLYCSLMVVATAVSIAILAPYYSSERPERLRERAQAITARSPAVASIIFIGTTRTPTEYYLKRSQNFPTTALVYPPFLENDPGQGWFDRSEIETSPAKYIQWAIALVEKTSASINPGDEIAVVEEVYFADGRTYRWRGEALLLDAFIRSGYTTVAPSKPTDGVVFLKRGGGA